MEERIKDAVLNLGADLCGLAHIDAFEAAPSGFHPADIYGDCRSVVVLAKRMPRGAGQVGPRIVYNRANVISLEEADRLAYQAALVIESFGAVAVPLPADSPYDYWEEDNLRGRGIMSLRHAAVLAGLGRLGRNTLVVNERLGNMMSLGAVLTNLDLATDPPAKELCLPKCRRCLENCPTGALDGQTADQKRCRTHTYSTNTRGYGVVNCNLCRTGCPLAFGVKRN